ncbi:MAG: DUF4876 domain-containing protein [Calditrichaceae bacterium]
MNFYLKNRTVKGLLIFGLIISLNTCQESITHTETAQFAVQVSVSDTSYVTKGITQDIKVIGANVQLFSVNYNVSYQAWTDGRGIAVIDGMVPDYYNISVQMTYPEDTVNVYLGFTQEISLVGSMASQKLQGSGDTVSLILKPVPRVSLILSEIYYNGALPPPGYYFHDQFTEIYNNSAVVEYLDNYVIGNSVYGYRDDPEFVHFDHLYKFPGNGTDYPVEPGQIKLIAQDAINHLEYNENSLDLSNVDFEYYNRLSNDVDNPFVINMIQVHHEFGIDFLYSVKNDAIVLAKLEPDDVLTYDEKGHILVPKAKIVDGVEYKEDLTNYEFKRLSDDIDAGLTGGMQMYQGKSIARKVFKVIDGQNILMDNNNSSLDFRVQLRPTPGSTD